jgi:hypothetical protein
MLLLLYRRLNVAYEPAILYLQGLEEQDFADAVSQLKESERRLLDEESAESQGPDTALSAGKQAKKKPRDPPAGFKVGECYHCHSTGHKRPQCPEYLKTLEGQNTTQSAATAAVALVPDSDKAWTARTAITLNSSSWIVDSGASRHMTGDCKLFTSDYAMFPKPQPIEIANGTSLQGLGSGTIRISLAGDAVTVSNVLYVPGLTTNLLSVSQLEDRNITISTGGGALKLHLGERTIATATRIGGSYVLSSLGRNSGHALRVADPAKVFETTGSIPASTTAKIWYL